jgi:hypothetical protein
MLAIQVVFASVDTTPTLVFDEVDSGVGGRAAVEVGRRLARLGRHHQVLCVTHLPQVAAFADTHLRVVKSSAGKVTASGIEALDDAGRVTELSRMLAGQEASASAQAHAQELLAMAAKDRHEAAAPSTPGKNPASTPRTTERSPATPASRSTPSPTPKPAAASTPKQASKSAAKQTAAKPSVARSGRGRRKSSRDAAA